MQLAGVIAAKLPKKALALMMSYLKSMTQIWLSLKLSAIEGTVAVKVRRAAGTGRLFVSVRELSL
ncbi:hypothetical protein WH43_07445 [Rheinheimera sp. KL1]|nr:hypothetical protein WH43_07445 [Rheinheimera sp. KL1]